MPSPLQRGLASQVVDLLRERILSGELAPGTRLNEVELARELEISRAPLREAIRGLTSEGLLTYRPNRGAVVFDADVDEITALFELRTALETSATRLAADRRSAAALEDLQEICRRSREVVTAGRHFPYRLDLEFHRCLMQAAASPRIAEQAWAVQQQVIVLRSQRARDPAHTQASLDDHEAIASAVAAGHARQAAELMTTHLDRVCRHMLAGRMPHAG